MIFDLLTCLVIFTLEHIFWEIFFHRSLEIAWVVQ